jgi:hypothetical protein
MILISIIRRTSRWVIRSIWLLLFLLSFSLFIASHTVASVAALTSAAFSAIAGVSTVHADGKAKNTQQARLAARMQSELELERTVSNSLAEDVNIELNTNRRLQAELTELDLERAITAQLATELSLERNQSRNLSQLLGTERNRAESLQLDNARLRASQTVNFRGVQTPIRVAISYTLSSANARVVKTAAANVGSMPAEAIPFYGVAIIAAATAFEVDMACRTMDDFYELQVALDPELALPEGREERCGIAVPTKDEIWTLVKQSPGAAWSTSVESLSAVSDSVLNIETPDFGSAWQRLVQYFDHWF